jgi:hypothetical protein
MAAALIDRVLHHCHLVNIRGNSYRMREHTDLYRALQSDVENSAEAGRPPRRSKGGVGIETKKVRNFEPPEVGGLRPALTLLQNPALVFTYGG